MVETRLTRPFLLGFALVCYAVIFTALCMLSVPAVGITAFFVIPTAVLAIAGGPLAGAGSALVAPLLSQRLRS